MVRNPTPLRIGPKDDSTAINPLQRHLAITEAIRDTRHGFAPAWSPFYTFKGGPGCVRANDYGVGL
jgi:hypothetical protein